MGGDGYSADNGVNFVAICERFSEGVLTFKRGGVGD